MYKHLIISATLLPFALITTPSLARSLDPQLDEQSRMALVLEQFDTDGNGRITREEIEAVRAAEFASTDLDGDGALSYAELQALEQQHKAERLAHRFATLDADDSGAISDREFVDGHPHEGATAAAFVFSTADTDANDRLSLTELEALKQLDPSPWHFANLDQNSDGDVSQDEFVSASSPRRRGRSIRF